MSVLSPGGGGIQNMQDGYKDHLRLLTWIAALVLLVACANIANLLLVRGMSRRAELLDPFCARCPTRAHRASDAHRKRGPCRPRRPAWTVISFVAARALLMLAFPDQHNMPVHAMPSPLVIGFAFGLSLATGILFGLRPRCWPCASSPLKSALQCPHHRAGSLLRPARIGRPAGGPLAGVAGRCRVVHPKPE